MNENDVLDNLLDQIGDFGRLQLTALFLICGVVVFHSATHVAYAFTALDSDYRCLIPGCDGSDAKYETNWLDNAIPSTSNNVYDKCEMYDRINNSINVFNNCTATAFNRSNVVKCDEFVFRDNENYIAREFGLLCEENLWKLTLVGTLNTLGMFFGLLITGVISDKYGRKFVLLGGICGCGIFGLIKAFSPTYEWFCVFEFIEAVFAAGIYVCGFILGVELVTPKNRVITGCISCTSYALGEVLVAAVAWAVKDWKLLIYYLYGPCALCIFLYWSIPESIRWYLSKGKLEEAKDVLRKFAKANNKSISEGALNKLKLIIQEQEELHESVSFVEMLKSWPLLLRFLNVGFCWMTCAFLFYGLTLNSVTLSANSYADFMYISLTEVPAYWASTYVSNRYGRKYTMSVSYALASISCFAFLSISSDIEWLHTIVYCLGKFGATSAFILIYVVASEMFPTSLRNTTMGITSMVARLGAIMSPQIPLLAKLWKPLPLLLFASLAAVATVTSLFFPETLNLKLPDTIKEAENIGKKVPTDTDSIDG
ncbi:hypothetical protein WA026_005536 [Henosepilachna vigintioctopunctata]|uniref:Major facilitator superfamily (MFS) profile domain-containing protein n=1 Tax=Henosepilachna vigintioctopunctata TaxID=420089 RepID=A0AAW1U240_9CUCU